MKTVFLPTTLITHQYLAFCSTEKQFKAVLKRLKVKEYTEFVRKGANATTTFLENGNGRCAIVCLDISKTPRVAKESIYGVLVHEAVHVFEDYCDMIGETKPSSEFSAYAVQCLSEKLWDAYNQHLKYKNKYKKS